MTALLKALPYLIKAAPYLIGLAALVLGVSFIHHLGYTSGEASMRAYYKPRLEAIEAQGRADAKDAKERESALQTQFTDSERRYAETEKAHEARLDASRERITRLVSDISAHRFCPAPQTPTHPQDPGAAPGVSELSGRIGAALTSVGERASRDARRLGECEGLLRTERNLLN
jgi:hypothetical protein